MDTTITILKELNFSSYIEALSMQAKDRAGQAQSWMNWAESLRLVKQVSSPIPGGVLPNGFFGVLADFKVDSRGPDDVLYDNNKTLREKLARGNTFMQLNNGDWSCVLYAMKKFTGGMGDDDDRDDGGDNQIWKRYFTKNYDEATAVLSTRKVNGEAAHLSCVKIADEFYLCTGSKNVHMLIGEKSDINKYQGGRYKVAAEIALSVMEFLEELSESAKNKLLGFLTETKLTAVFEILNPTHQHVEDLTYLGQRCALKFITWTSTDLNPSDKLCVVPPDVGVKIAAHLGLDVVEIEEISIPEAEQHMLKIREEYGHEGVVLYFLDGNRDVIGLVKKKTAWYIICRAIREKVRNALSAKNGYDLKKTAAKIKTRIIQIQSWLGLSDNVTLQWITLGQEYLDWCAAQSKNHKLTRSDVADLFPVTWTRFLNETDRSDRIHHG